MKLYDSIDLAARNLREALLRNSLTTLGIGVGIASLVAMLSLGIGLQRLFNKQLGRSGLFDSIFVTSRQDFRGPRSNTVSAPRKPLDDAARKSFTQISGVAEVYANVGLLGEFRLEGSKDEDPRFGGLTGLPFSARTSEAFDEFQGKFFSGPNAPEAVITADF